MQRAFEIDVLKCNRPGCRGRLKFIACVTEPTEIDAILRSLGKPSLSPSCTSGKPTPPPTPPRSPPSRFGPLFDAVI